MTGPGFRPMRIGGEWVDSLSGEHIDVEAPFGHERAGSVPRGKDEDVDRAVRAATAAFPSWRRIPPRDRGRMISAVGADLESHLDELAREVSRETGNAIRTQSRPEVTQAADFFRYFGGLAGEMKGEVVPHNESLLNYTVREPLGVIGGIVPWNSPAMLGAAKITMALAAGNTVVIKSPEDAPFTIMPAARRGQCGQRVR
jgi:betaine-aldehyde dehydrogenase